MPSHTPEEIQKGIVEAQRLANLAKQQFAVSGEEGAKTTQFHLGTATPITGADLTSSTNLNFKTPTISEPFPVKDIPIPEFAPTQPEKEASAFSKQLQSLNERLLGQSAFKTEQEGALGVEGFRKTQLDLTNQLRSLQAEAEATKISPEFEQRNVLQPFAEGERGRKLRDVGVRALIVGANLQAAQGNLAAALDQVDRAVAQKFGPIEEEIRVKKENLDLIINDPATSLADKNRAIKQKAEQDKIEKETKKQEEEQKEIWKIGVDVTKSGVDAITLRNIQGAKTKEEALRLAAPFLKKEEKVTGQSDFEQAFLRDKGRLPTVTELLDFEREKGVAGRKPEIDDTSEDAIDVWARRINIGTDKISSVPNNIRNKVIARTKDFAEEDLAEDITAGLAQGLKEDELIKKLQEGYPEFSKAEIEKKVKGTTPVAQSQKEGGFISSAASAVGSFFGSLFR